MPYSLKGRNALVTGGSRGLGALISEKLAQEGANVMVNYVSAEDRAKEVVEKCESYGVKAFATKGVSCRVLRPTVSVLLTRVGCWQRRGQRPHCQGDSGQVWWYRHHHCQRRLDKVLRLQGPQCFVS